MTLKVNPVTMTDCQVHGSNQLKNLELGVSQFKFVSQFQFIKLSVSQSHLDVLAEEVGIETQPVSGNVEPAL